MDNQTYNVLWAIYQRQQHMLDVQATQGKLIAAILQNQITPAGGMTADEVKAATDRLKSLDEKLKAIAADTNVPKV